MSAFPVFDLLQAAAKGTQEKLSIALRMTVIGLRRPALFERVMTAPDCFQPVTGFKHQPGGNEFQE